MKNLAQLKQKLKDLMTTYGWLALVIWFVIFGLVICGFAAAFRMGFSPEGKAETTGVWGAAYIATQVTKPLRIAATLLLTPIVARLPVVARFLPRGDTPTSVVETGPVSEPAGE